MAEPVQVRRCGWVVHGARYAHALGGLACCCSALRLRACQGTSGHMVLHGTWHCMGMWYCSLPPDFICMPSTPHSPSVAVSTTAPQPSPNRMHVPAREWWEELSARGSMQST